MVDPILPSYAKKRTLVVESATMESKVLQWMLPFGDRLIPLDIPAGDIFFTEVVLSEYLPPVLVSPFS